MKRSEFEGLGAQLEAWERNEADWPLSKNLPQDRS